MKIEIWSDIACPFCYIGKRHLEEALSSLSFKNEIDIEWKSYMLNPDYKNLDQEDFYTYLSRNKGMSKEQVEGMTAQVAQMASHVGIDLNFKNNVPANTFHAHRLIQLAKTKGLQDEAEELLFKAHLVEGLNMDDESVLIDLGQKIGLDAAEVANLFETDIYSGAVQKDIYESQTMNVRGVPYFVLDRKYALSGAQPIEAFKEAISQSYKEWAEAKNTTPLKNLNGNDGAICDENGCEI